jgi:hypothetical protein
MKHIITLLALSLLAGGNLNAQTNTNTSNWTAYNELKNQMGAAWNVGVPEVLPIVEAIIAQPSISTTEAKAVGAYYDATVGREQRLAVYSNIAAKSPYVASVLKTVAKDYDWTDEMLRVNLRDAAGIALSTDAPADFKRRVWEEANNRIVYKGAAKFFKVYRATLPKAEQLAATQAQKDLLLAKTSRSDIDNAWLAEVSADLIALSLDQTQ